MSVHPLPQAYLDSGLITWYEVKGNDKERLTETERAAVESNSRTNHLVCAALQIAAPAFSYSHAASSMVLDSIDVTESASRGLVLPTVAASALHCRVGSRARGAPPSAPPPSPSPTESPVRQLLP